MAEHFHGTPLTPKSALRALAGKNFCVPFSDPRDAADCLAFGQKIMFDNGAYTAFQQGRALDVAAYYKWLEPLLAPPHRAVVPDVIDGSVEDQLELVAGWPFPQRMGWPVWHMALSIDYLLSLADQWPELCFGSSRQYWQIGSDLWCRRVDEAFNALSQRHPILPHVHMLRGMNMTGDRWPFASVDSVNVARNFKDSNTDPERMARRIDAVQCPVKWIVKPQQEPLFA